MAVVELTEPGAPRRPWTSMLLVYAIPVSLYCAKLRILLRHRGLEWREEPPPGGYSSAEHKKIVPTGNLPALVDAGLIIADSEAIAEYLNEKHPDPPMLPASLAGRARIRERSRFHDTRLEPAVRALFGHIPPSEPNPQRVQAQSQAISERLGQFGELLSGRDLATDDQLTLGDCGFPITFAWIEALAPVLGFRVEWPDAVGGYRSAIERHPAAAAELSEYVPGLVNWLKSRETA